MTWSYNSALPTDKDKVRLLIGDTDTDDQLLQDEEITYFLSVGGSVQLAAARAAEAIAAKFARMVDKTVGDLSLSASQKHKQYLALAKSLKAGLSTLASPYAGGISVADKDARELDTDRVKPAFTRELHQVVPTE